jgi:protein-S-isoprenylcysteine O-methyltransferase Ste14
MPFDPSMPARTRIFLELLIPALWIAWMLYWWIAARGAMATRRRESALSRISYVVPLLIAVWLLAARRVPIAILNEPVLPKSIGLFAAGASLTVIGLAFTVWARVHLAGNWSATVTIKENHTLVRDGPYRYVRHPIYTGLLLAFVGSALARDEWRALLAVAIAFYSFWRKLRLEERWLTEVFGDAYRLYREEVRALIPFVV